MTAGFPNLVVINDPSGPTVGVDVAVTPMGRMRQPCSSGPRSRGSFREWHPAWLSRGRRAGLGVILAVAESVAGLVFSSGDSSTYSNRGGCNAQGSGNTVLRSGGATETGR
jgi:hypothetical protein